MAASSLSPSADAVSVTIPPERFERFVYEVEFTLSSATENFDQARRWARRMDKPADFRAENATRAATKEREVRAAAHMRQQVDSVNLPEGDTTIEGARYTLRETVIGCVLACGGDVHGAVEERDNKLARVRGRIAELEFWLDRLEEIGQEQLDGEAVV